MPSIPLLVRHRAHRITTVLLLVTGAGAGLTSCASGGRPASEDPLAGLETRTVEGDGFTRLEAHGVGAGHFEAVKPDDWNGKLLLWLHGGTAAPATQPVWCSSLGEFQRRAVLELGFGLACASFVGGTHGVWPLYQDRDTRIAEALFVRHFGEPDAVFLGGNSAGVFGALKLIESGGGEYAGFLSVCGGLGGARPIVRLVLDVREIFEVFYPEVLPGHAWDTPDVDWQGEVVPRITGTVDARPRGARELARVDQVELPAVGPEETRRALLANLRFSVDLASEPGYPGTAMEALRAEAGGIPVGNVETRYRGSSDDRDLNERIRRFAADPAAARILEDMYEPRGILNVNGHRTRVMALHTSRDPIALPRITVRTYEALLANNGDGDLLETRYVDRFGHCNLSPDEILAALEDLVKWVETGERP